MQLFLIPELEGVSRVYSRWLYLLKQIIQTMKTFHCGNGLFRYPIKNTFYSNKKKKSYMLHDFQDHPVGSKFFKTWRFELGTTFIRNFFFLHIREKLVYLALMDHPVHINCYWHLYSFQCCIRFFPISYSLDIRNYFQIRLYGE